MAENVGVITYRVEELDCATEENDLDDSDPGYVVVAE